MSRMLLSFIFLLGFYSTFGKGGAKTPIAESSASSEVQIPEITAQAAPSVDVSEITVSRQDAPKAEAVTKEASVMGTESYKKFEQRQKSIKYIIKEGDTISEILWKHGYKGLYKHAGEVHKTLWKNGIDPDDVQDLEVGDVIYLPLPSQERSPANVASVSSDELYEKEDKPVVIKNRMFSRAHSRASHFDLVNDEGDESDLYSESQMAVDLLFEHQRNNWIYSIGGEFNSITMVAPEGGSISDSSFSQSLLRAGIGHQWENKLRMDLYFGQGLLVFPESGEDTEITTKIGTYNYLEPTLSYTFNIRKMIRLIPHVSVVSVLSSSNLTNYKISSGSGARAGADLTFDRKKYSFILGFDYETISLTNDSNEENKVDAIGANFGFQFNF